MQPPNWHFSLSAKMNCSWLESSWLAYGRLVRSDGDGVDVSQHITDGDKADNGWYAWIVMKECMSTSANGQK